MSNTRRRKLKHSFQLSSLIKVQLLAVFLAVQFAPARAQDTMLIKGVVLSHLDQALEGVSLSVQGSSELPVLTNEAGEFTIKSASGKDWIIVSPTGGFKNKRVYLNDMRSLTIHLSPKDISAGDDEISLLNQLVKRKDLVSAVSELDPENTHHSSAISIDQYMQANVAGMYVVSRSGMPGSGAVTTLRGINSLYANNQPLYIVDGIPVATQDLFNSKLGGFDYNPLLSINPYDISQVNVIKDPSVTSAFGSKASNGMIVISTLDPSVTQTVIELDYRNGFSLATSNFIPQLSGGQHKTLISELLISSGEKEESIIELYPNLFLEKEDVRYIDYQHNTNWQELIFNDAWYTNFNLNVKGGDEIARYGLSFGYTDGNGIIKNTDFNGYNLRFVSRLNVFTWLKMNAGVALTYNKSSMKEAGIVHETSPIATSLAKTPLLNPYQYDYVGYELTILSEVDELGVSNPLATVQNFSALNSNFSFVSTIGAEGIITDNLKLKSRFNLTYNVLKEQIFMPNLGMELYYDDEAYNVAKLSNNDLNSFYNNTFLVYEKMLSNDHRVTANTGVNIQSNKYQYDWGLSKNAHRNDEYKMINDGQDNLREIGGENRNWNWLSFYEYVTYSYKDKYLLTGSVSLDGTSRVGDSAINTMNLGGAPFGLFYGIGTGWRISQESFMKDLTWLEELKLRVALGRSGNDDIGEANASNYYEAVKFRETVGLYPATIPNGNLSYETVTQLTAGLDIALLGNRFSASFDLYRSTTDNMIVYSPLESYMGFDLRIQNGGKMVNNGWEVSTFLRLAEKGSFKWDLQANVASFSNEVTEIVGGELVYGIPGAEKINKVGYPANSFYGYVFNGVYASQLDAEDATNGGGLVNDKNIPYAAGDAIYEDISGPNDAPDGVINDYDKTIIGSAQPKIFGGLSTAVTYKRWTLSTTFNFVSGVDLFNYMRYKNESMTDLSNQSAAVLSRWQYDGQETMVPRALFDDPMGNASFSTRWIEDGSFIRLRNISLSYKIPDKFLVFRSAEFYLTANNILTLTNYLGYDPEFAYSHSQIYQGVDYGQMPQARQFIAGVRIGL